MVLRARALLCAAFVLATPVVAIAQTITEFPLPAPSQPGSAIFYGATVDNRTGDPSMQVARAAP